MPKIIFVNKEGEERVIEARNGQTILEIAHQEDLPLEGACEGSLARSSIWPYPYFKIRLSNSNN